MAWLNIKNPEVDNNSQKVSYDEISFGDFFLTRVRLFVIENRDVISVALILILGFGVIWTARFSSQSTTVNTQAADVGATPVPTLVPTVTILVATPTLWLSATPTLLPTLPLEWLPTSIITPAVSPRPTNPYFQYLK